MAILREKLIEIYTSLLKIRKVELAIEDVYPQDEMKTPVHLCLGQEAVSAGVCANLRQDDPIFSNHRSHGHYLAKGGDLKKMMAELYCKETGCAKGRGGSMHLIDTSVSHFGSSAIVAGGIPHAVGAAFAAKMQKKDIVAVTFFGDAGCEQGVFYESMNWAKLKQLPVVFICENNFYAVCSHLKARQIVDDIGIRSRSFDIPSMRIDGTNAVEVYEKSRDAIEYARSGKGPCYLVFDVHRLRGHSGHGDPLKSQYRTPEEIDNPDVRDPLQEFEKHVLSKGIDKKQLEKIAKEIDKEIKEAFQFAKESSLPDVGELEKYLYS